MKASEVIKKYAAGERNFQRVNLRGQSFKKKDLSGADFSEADIHGANFSEADIYGADFTGATLTKAHFVGAKCGLQKRWAAFLIIISWFLAAMSGLLFRLTAGFVWQVFRSNANVQLLDAVTLTLMVSFLLVIIRKGLKIQAGIVPLLLFISMFTGIMAIGAETIEGAGVRAFAFAVAFALIVIIVFTLAVIFAVTFTVGRIPAVLATVLFALMFEFSKVGVKTSVGTLAGMFTFVIAGAFIAFLSMREEETNSWIRSFNIAITTIKGTKFRDAELTDANFTRAKLECTDLRKAILTRVHWHKAEMLHLVRHDNAHLKSTQIRQWLIGEGIDKNFDGQSLQGINLQGAVLTDASFVNANLSEANLAGTTSTGASFANANLNGADLQRATLFEAKLIQTNLDKANLSNANLTGAYIENWGITRNTIFEGVKGDYVYQNLPTKYDRDPNRMPPPQQGNFGENDLYIFITSVLDTLDLYHRQNINAGVAITVLKGLTEDYPVKFELVGIVKRGDNQYVMKLKVFGQASHFQLQREYYARYEQSLPLYDPKMLMPDSENMVAEIIKRVEENPGTYIENLNNQGIVITGGEVDMSGGRNIEIKEGNYNENIKGDYYEH